GGDDANGAQGGGQGQGADGSGESQGAGGNGNAQGAEASEGAGGGSGTAQPGDGDAKPGSKAADGGRPTGEHGMAADGKDPIDVDTIPDNPLEVQDTDDAATQAAKEALAKSLRSDARDMGGKIHDAELDREGYDPGDVGNKDVGRSGGPKVMEREWETTGASGASPELGYDGDDEVDLDELLKTYDDKIRNRRDDGTHLTAYDQIAKKHKRAIQEMVDELTNFFQRDDIPELIGHFRGGVYDLRKAIQSEFRRQATGRGDPRIFLKRDEPRERSVEVVFCIDCSGSMGNGANSKMEFAREAFVVFLESLGEIGVGNGVVMYNSGVSVLKPIEEDKSKEEREQMLGKLRGGGGNNDTAALDAARQMLEDSPAEQKIVIFLSDGAAVANHNQAVRNVAQETDIKIIGIGIGAGCQQVPTTYEHSMVVENTEKLPRMLGDLLMDEIMGN
ncbi:MAG: VWA domain-containing protein, partial [Deltaproteobacteria bacterium]